MEGLEANQINKYDSKNNQILRSCQYCRYSHIINGYIGSRSFLIKLGEVVKKLKEVPPAKYLVIKCLHKMSRHCAQVNPSLIYVCDPVMGDSGPGLYVPK